MDVLKPTLNKRRSRWTWAALLSWLAVSACLSITSQATRTEPSFPHRVHVVDNQLACTFCHGTAVAGERPGMPPPELCATCHDKFDDDKPASRRITAFFDEHSRYRTVAESGLTEDVMFSHRHHVNDANIDCTVCHGDVAEQTSVPLQPLATKAMCMNCHQDRGMTNECSECHRSIDRSWAPPNHVPSRGWLRAHGELASAHGHEDDAASNLRCSLCHQDATGCNACHQQMPPNDHNSTFRLRTHGLRASIDRSRCATCHQQASCEQCHQSTQPRNHRGGFGAPKDRHCVGCHFPLAEEGCATCHRTAPSHQLATPLPGDHNSAMNCRLCHGQGQSLPHPDGGHACTICHK